MKHILLTDKKKRQYFKNFEQKQKILKFLTNHLTLSSKIRQKLFWQFDELSSKYSSVYIHNYCVISGRARGVYSHFNLSRLVIKRLHGSGYLPNFNKSS